MYAAVSPAYDGHMRVPETPLKGASVVVRRATLDDADLLVAWHGNPEVSRYWDGAIFTHDEMLIRLRRPAVDSYIVEEKDEPVGGFSCTPGRRGPQTPIWVEARAPV
jgi:hypothetical protein